MDVGADAAAKKGRRGMEGKKDYEERENGSRRGGIREWKGIIIALIAGMTAVANNRKSCNPNADENR